ncbi:MAG TPA: response regulator [Blastocatellia bacterium]|nr:response regulator [Blastocatellia bacterium]
MAKQKTILLVEDYEGFRNSLKQLLELEGYEVSEAVTGEEAVEQAARNKPDMILMDLTLPGMSGLSAAKQIRQIPELKQAPIIALSAFDAEDFSEDAIGAGCNEYVTKPVDFDQLTRLLTKFLG